MSDCFIKLDDVKGEVTDGDKELAGAIAVKTWHWGAQWSGELRNAAAKGRPGEIRHFTFDHSIDLASPSLMGRCLGGELIPKGTLTMRRAGKTPQPFLKIEFEKVRIVSVDLNHADSEQLPLERVVFAFKACNVRYTRQGEDGADLGSNKFSHRVDD